MGKPKLFPGFPKGERGIIKTGVMETAKNFNQGGAKSKQLGAIMSVLGDALSDESLYEEIYKKIDVNYNELGDWWNNEWFKKRGGKIGTGEYIVTEIDSDEEAEKAIEGIDPRGFYLLQMQLMASKSDGVLVKLEFTPDFAEQISIFNRILWTIFISTFKPGGLDKLSSVFREKSGKNWA